MKTESPVESAPDLSEPSADKVLEHLDDICASPFFVSSKRCQQFLRYVVGEALDGRGPQIKERNIAHEVFGKGNNFEPGEYSLVRVKAGEVRKRLSDYYESTPANCVRIELPVGSYVPRIHAAMVVPQATEPIEPDTAIAAKPFNRRRFFWIAGGSLGLLGASSLVPLLRPKATPLDLLWRPVFATKTALLIFIPVMHEPNGDMTVWVGIGPAAAMRRAADFLDAHRYPYHLRFGAELTFAQLREQPSLLLGGFEVDWTLRMTRDLRFAPFLNTQTGERSFIDKETKQMWTAVKHPPNPYVDVDYGILCRLFDSITGQIVFLAVGTQTFGTEGAASLLFNPELFAQVVKQAPSNWETRNLQAVIRVSVIGTTPSTPQLVATHFW
jgi:hypothetical protein